MTSSEGAFARALVTGAGGFIGHHLISYLTYRGYRVRGVDLKEPEFEPTRADEFVVGDLRDAKVADEVTRDIDEVYHLAADMGGIGYITSNHASIVRNDTLINVNTIHAAHENGASRLLYSSSACVYPQYKQLEADVTPLREEDAWPADPEEGYGLEKLYMEKICQYYREDLGLDTRVVRFHNVYGPLGTYEGGKEKAPAALCRKIAGIEDGGEIEVWGDGKQTRSFLYIEDCVEGIHRLMRSDHVDPLNLGSDRLVTVDDLIEIISGAAGKRVEKRYDTSKPQGVRGRNSDNTRLRAALGWEPSISLEDGLARTYEWIAGELAVREAPAAVG
ncbi:MAG: NAD-dependent epimerase/dehydratase family protein [Gemmatimonadota bacterium]|nr:NAD-dependent epimerase/dehydratase family protein [Gemmatimonadota bacterium]